MAYPDVKKALHSLRRMNVKGYGAQPGFKKAFGIPDDLQNTGTMGVPHNAGMGGVAPGMQGGPQMPPPAAPPMSPRPFGFGHHDEHENMSDADLHTEGGEHPADEMAHPEEDEVNHPKSDTSLHADLDESAKLHATHEDMSLHAAYDRPDELAGYLDDNMDEPPGDDEAEVEDRKEMAGLNKYARKSEFPGYMPTTEKPMSRRLEMLSPPEKHLDHNPMGEDWERGMSDHASMTSGMGDTEKESVSRADFNMGPTSGRAKLGGSFHDVPSDMHGDASGSMNESELDLGNETASVGDGMSRSHGIHETAKKRRGAPRGPRVPK